MRRGLKVLIILVILIGMPLFAWYFLNEGTQMRKEAMAYLTPKETISNFQCITESESLFYSDSLIGKRWLVGILGGDDNRVKAAQVIENLYKQTSIDFDINVFTITGLIFGEKMSDVGHILNWPQNNKKWVNTYMAKDHVYPFANSIFIIPEKYQSIPCAILLDEHNRVRNYYSLIDESDVKSLVRHLPVFLSLKN